MRFRVLGGMVAVVLASLGVAACRDNPNIDGSKIAPSGATCSEVCPRIVALCGYAPPDCDDDVDAAGYCQTNFDDTILACMSTAASCKDAWDCPTAAPASDDAGDDGPADDSSTDDSGDAASD